MVFNEISCRFTVESLKKLFSNLILFLKAQFFLISAELGLFDSSQSLADRFEFCFHKLVFAKKSVSGLSVENSIHSSTQGQPMGMSPTYSDHHWEKKDTKSRKFLSPTGQSIFGKGSIS